MVHGGDDRARRQEQKRLEKSVCEQMEHGPAIGRNTGGGEHVTKLGTGGIRNHTFDVVLEQRNRCGKERGGRTDKGDKAERDGRLFKQGRCAAHQKHTGRHHRRGMDQRGDRCWTLHRVGQPCVQNKLRRFAHRANKQQQTQRRQNIDIVACEHKCLARKGGRGGKHGIEIQRTKNMENAVNTERKPEIAHAVDDKRLDRGGIGRRLVVPKPDQQV